MNVFGAIFLLTAILIALLKNENSVSSSSCWHLFRKKSPEELAASEQSAGGIKHEKLSLVTTYMTIYRICLLAPIRKFAIYLLTYNVLY
jgi:hypothetical protein